MPLTGSVAAVSCGVVDGVPLLDLDYPEDSSAEVDANVVMTGEGGLIEVQATAERTPLSRAHLDDLLALAEHGHHRAARRPGRRWSRDPRHAQRAQGARVRAPARRAPVQPLPDSAPTPEETGATFAENALIKARSAAASTDRAAFADDSGIGAGHLDWAPGVRSARYAGPTATDEENLAKLIEEVPPGTPLRYTCVIAHVAADGTETLFEGTCDGVMAASPPGEGGFGYDPVFDLPDGRTMAQLPDDEKDAISHRGIAARAFADWLSQRAPFGV